MIDFVRKLQSEGFSQEAKPRRNVWELAPVQNLTPEESDQIQAIKKWNDIKIANQLRGIPYESQIAQMLTAYLNSDGLVKEYKPYVATKHICRHYRDEELNIFDKGLA